MVSRFSRKRLHGADTSVDWTRGLIDSHTHTIRDADAYREGYGAAALREVMPVKKMIASGAPFTAGTDAKRVSSYNPWLAIH